MSLTIRIFFHWSSHDKLLKKKNKSVLLSFFAVKSVIYISENFRFLSFQKGWNPVQNVFLGFLFLSILLLSVVLFLTTSTPTPNYDLAPFYSEMYQFSLIVLLKTFKYILEVSELTLKNGNPQFIYFKE